MTRRTIPVVVVLGMALVLPVAAAQSAAPAQSSAPAAQDDTWPPAGVFRMNQDVQAPEIVTERKPSYTAEAMRARVEGVVEVQAIVQADGKVGEVRVIRSLDKEFGLDDEAVKAVKGWVFKPGRKDGKAVPVLVNIELTFSQRKR